jgi:hypothetical protein
MKERVKHVMQRSTNAEQADYDPENGHATSGKRD